VAKTNGQQRGLLIQIITLEGQTGLIRRSLNPIEVRLNKTESYFDGQLEELQRNAHINIKAKPKSTFNFPILND
jgi:hypothetical protein